MCELYLKKWGENGKEVLSDMGLITHEIKKTELKNGCFRTVVLKEDLRAL